MVEGKRLFTLRWGHMDQVHTAVIENSRELNDYLDDINDKFRDEYVLISSSEGSQLGIGLGRDLSVLTFDETDAEGPYFVSIGKYKSDAPISFSLEDEDTEFSIDNAVEIEDAREAARLYVETGKRPDNIKWKEV